MILPVEVDVNVGGKFIFKQLNDLAAQSHSNNLGRYYKVGTTLLK